MSDLLQLDCISAGYGGSVILDDVSLAIAEGESLALLGRNGVGKTTLLLTLLGLTRLHAGRMEWCGTDLSRLPIHQRASAGIGWVPQERSVFRSLTVEENLRVVARPGLWSVQSVFSMFPRLQERRSNLGYQLSGGEQQMLAIARALLINPRLLLLDEPTEGLAPMIIEELIAAIQQMISRGGMAVIVVEQHARLALMLTKNAIVLDRGRIVHRSDSRALLDDPEQLSRVAGVA